MAARLTIQKIVGPTRLVSSPFLARAAGSFGIQFEVVAKRKFKSQIGVGLVKQGYRLARYNPTTRCSRPIKPGSNRKAWLPLMQARGRQNGSVGRASQQKRVRFQARRWGI